MSIVVFWLCEGQPSMQPFDDAQLKEALAFAEAHRKERDAHGQARNAHVVISTELGHCVSKPGVSDQLPPDYSWTKQHRGGPPGPDGPRTLG